MFGILLSMLSFFSEKSILVYFLLNDKLISVELLNLLSLIETIDFASKALCVDMLTDFLVTSVVVTQILLRLLILTVVEL